MTRRRFIQATVALTILVTLIQCTWAFVMPPFRGPDEPVHTNSIFRLESGNGWPEPGDAMVDPVIMTASKEAGLLRPYADEFTIMDRSKLYTGSINPMLFATTIVTGHPDRTPISNVEASSPEGTVRDQMVQHPPAYYAGGALVAKVAGLDSVPWDRALYVLRLYSILWALPLVPSMVYAARKLGAAREWSLLAGLLPLSIPQVSAVIGTVTNDAMVVGTGALAIAAMVKAGKDEITPATIGLVGASVGLALWSKGQMLALGLPLILIFLLKKAPWVKKLTAVAASGILSMVICPWWLMNIIRYGSFQPDGFKREPFDDWETSFASPWRFIDFAWSTMTESFVARFGWLEVPMSEFFVYNLLLALVVFWGIGVAKMADKRVVIAIATAVPGILAVILRQSWAVYQETGYLAGVQGRYLYPFLALLAVCVLGLAAASLNQRFTFRVAGTVILVYNVLGLWTLLYASYFGEPVNFDRFSLVVGFEKIYIFAVLISYILVIVLLWGAVWMFSRALPTDRAATLLGDDGVAEDDTYVSTVPSATSAETVDAQTIETDPALR